MYVVTSFLFEITLIYNRPPKAKRSGHMPTTVKTADKAKLEECSDWRRGVTFNW